MPKLIDLIGQKFGRLIVIRRMDNSKCNGTRWLCKCDCGKRKTISAGIPYKSIWWRLDHNWSIKKALTTPVRKHKRNGTKNV